MASITNRTFDISNFEGVYKITLEQADATLRTEDKSLWGDRDLKAMSDFWRFREACVIDPTNQSGYFVYAERGNLGDVSEGMLATVLRIEVMLNFGNHQFGDLPEVKRFGEELTLFKQYHLAYRRGEAFFYDLLDEYDCFCSSTLEAIKAVYIADSKLPDFASSALSKKMEKLAWVKKEVDKRLG